MFFAHFEQAILLFKLSSLSHEELAFVTGNESFISRQKDFMFLMSQHQDYQSTGAILEAV